MTLLGSPTEAASQLQLRVDFVLSLRDAGQAEFADWWERNFASQPPLEYGDGALDPSRNVLAEPTAAADLKAEMVAEHEARVAAHREEDRAWQKNVAPPKQKRKRRSKAEMVEVRARAAERIQRAHDRATPDWLKAADAEAEAEYTAALHDEDAA